MTSVAETGEPSGGVPVTSEGPQMPEDQQMARSLMVGEQTNTLQPRRSRASLSIARASRGRSVHTSARLTFVEEAISKRCMTKRQRGIVVTMTLFATITSAQFVAAFAANSLALLGDCASMAVDTLSYGANLYAECRPGQNQERNQLVASAVSIVVLLAITAWVISDAIGILTGPEEGDDDVNPYIVFAFALGGLLFDFTGLFALWIGQKKEKGTGTAGDLNMKTACLHVFADSLRSTTTLIESILIWFFDFNGTRTDAIAALCVSALIILPCFEMMRELWFEWSEYRMKAKDSKGKAMLEGYVPITGEGEKNLMYIPDRRGSVN